MGATKECVNSWSKDIEITLLQNCAVRFGNVLGQWFCTPFRKQIENGGQYCHRC